MNTATYESLLRRANGILIKYKIQTLDPGDLISETLIKYGFDDEDLFAKQMFTYAGVLKENSYQKEDIEFQHDRVCRRCKDNKPSICFRSWRVRGYLIFDSYCSVCKNIIVSMSKKKRRAAIKAEIYNVKPKNDMQCGVGKNNI